MDLVILAAGMGSRFGGLKQIQQIDDYGNFIIDYSVYDAIRAGFDKIIFVIKEENYEIFKETIGSRIESKIQVEYAFQTLDLLPAGYSIPQDRVKPLGTAQALLACRDLVSDTFAIINADDFYGKESFVIAARYLKTVEGKKNKYANVGYYVANTMTENGSVKRGVLGFDKNNFLCDICESKVEYKDGKVYMEPLDERIQPKYIQKDTLVSMNLFCFTKDIMEYLEDRFPRFLDENKNNLEKCEYLLPTVVDELIKEQRVSVEVLSTSSVWYGITYKADQENVEKSIKALVQKGDYKKGLW